MSLLSGERMTIRLRYRTLKLSALCWVLRRLRAGHGGRRDESEKPLIGRARSGVVRPDQGQKVTGLGGSQAKTNKQYSGQIQAILAGAPPSEP